MMFGGFQIVDFRKEFQSILVYSIISMNYVYLLESLEEIGSRHRHNHIYVVYDEERFIGGLIWEIGHIVRNIHKLLE